MSGSGSPPRYVGRAVKVYASVVEIAEASSSTEHTPPRSTHGLSAEAVMKLAFLEDKITEAVAQRNKVQAVIVQNTKEMDEMEAKNAKTLDELYDELEEIKKMVQQLNEETDY